jgi:phospholipid transport system transporter-binding protein
MPATDASVRKDGDRLVFSGTLERAAIAGLWAQALPLLAGVARFDLHAVAQVDSAGVALLAELAERVRTQAGALAIDGAPAGLAELCAAYRLAPDLGYAR